MKIMIAADMEGISGVVHWDHVRPGHSEYERFRAVMTADVNAAVRGAFEAGAQDVVVTDGHAYARNILVEQLDSRARLNSGSPAPFSMVQGVDREVDGVIFIGYHARVGTPQAILEHTWSSVRVAGVWLNEQPAGEIGLNSALCGHYGVPVLMISGDQSACAEAADLLGDIVTVQVKQAHGRMGAECLPPEVAQRQIQTAAAQAVTRLGQGRAPLPLRLPTPIGLKVRLVNSEMADRAAWMPGVRREDLELSYQAADMPTIYGAFRTIVALAG